jgi:hypothetical protein
VTRPERRETAAARLWPVRTLAATEHLSRALDDLGAQHGAEALERAVQRHLDGVRALPEQSGDVLRLQVGAVAERDQLAVAHAQARHRRSEVEPQDGEIGRASRKSRRAIASRAVTTGLPGR